MPDVPYKCLAAKFGVSGEPASALKTDNCSDDSGDRTVPGMWMPEMSFNGFLPSLRGLRLTPDMKAIATTVHDMCLVGKLNAFDLI